MQIKVKVAGNEISIREQTLVIESVITHQIDTCEFVTASAIELKQEIIVSNLDETVRYFAGYIATIGYELEGITLLHKCAAQDYTVLLDAVIVAKVYENMMDSAILADLFSVYLGEVNATTYVQSGRNHTRIMFNRITLYEAVAQLAEMSGFDWYVDYDKNLHYFHPVTNTAPFHLSDTPNFISHFPYSDLDYNKEAIKLVNRILIVGGTYLSDNSEFELANNGQATVLLLPYRLHKPTDATAVQVWRNTGSDTTPVWTPQTVGIDYLHNLTDYDCLYNYQEKFLKFATAPADLKRSARIRGRYPVPVLVRLSEQASYNKYSRWFDDKVIDQNIDSREWAQLVGKGILAERAFEKEFGMLVCTKDGLVSGQRVHIINALRNIDDYYLVNRVITRLIGGSVAQYSVEFGEYNPSLVDILLKIKRRAGQFVYRREDEIITELMSISETLGLVERMTLTPSGIPYYVVVGNHIIAHEGLGLAESVALTNYSPPTYLVLARAVIAHELFGLNETLQGWQQLKGQYCYAPKTDGVELREGTYDFASYG